MAQYRLYDWLIYRDFKGLAYQAGFYCCLEVRVGCCYAREYGRKFSFDLLQRFAGNRSSFHAQSAMFGVA